MKERIREIKEKVIRFLKNTDYEELRAEWEKQNRLIDIQEAQIITKGKMIHSLRNDLKQSRIEKQECILAGQNIIEEKTKRIKELENKLEEKEKARRKLASSIGGYKKQINTQNEKIEKLEKQVEFLKTNRRAPNLQELKDYTYGGKRK